MNARASSLLRAAVVPALGLATAVGAIAIQPGKGLAEWTVWAPLAMAVGAASGAAFVYGRRRVDELSRRYQFDSGPIWRRTLLLLLTAVVISNVSLVLPGAAHATLTPISMHTVAFVLGAPLAASMFAVRAALAGGHPDALRGFTVKQLVDLRGTLDRVLAAAGGLVALVTIEYSTRQLLNQSLHSGVAARPAAYTLVFGAFGSLIVGIAYFSGWGALRAHGQDILEDLVPIETLDAPLEVIGAMKERRDVASLLGVDRTILHDLTAGVVILSPIISGAIGAFAVG